MAVQSRINSWLRNSNCLFVWKAMECFMQFPKCMILPNHSHQFKTSEILIRYWPDTTKIHFLWEDISKETMYSLAASKEKDKSKSYFVKENKCKGHYLYLNHMKVFCVLYWICKEEEAIVKTISLLNMIEKLGFTELNDFETWSQVAILKIILVLPNIVREKPVDKIKQWWIYMSNCWADRYFAHLQFPDICWKYAEYMLNMYCICHC